jgi:hypothetical protein
VLLWMAHERGTFQIAAPALRQFTRIEIKDPNH